MRPWAKSHAMGPGLRSCPNSREKPGIHNMPRRAGQSLHGWPHTNLFIIVIAIIWLSGRCLMGSACLCLSCLAIILAVNPGFAQETIAKPLTEKQKRKREEKLRKELEAP